MNSYRMFKMSFLLLCGDIAMNPGPVKNPCAVCAKPIARTHCCVVCQNWAQQTHIKCANISATTYSQHYHLSDRKWFCSESCSFYSEPSPIPTLNNNEIHNNETEQTFTCENVCVTPLPIDSTCSTSIININDSYVPPADEEEDWKDLSNVINDSHHTSLNSQQECLDIFTEVKMLRSKDRKRPLIGHINNNSIRYKFQEIRDLFDRNLVDLFCVSETKIDDTFRDNLFSVDGYKLYRNDRDARGGGIMVFTRADLPIKRRIDLESEQLESICLEFEMQKRKWGLSVCIPTTLTF